MSTNYSREELARLVALVIEKLEEEPGAPAPAPPVPAPAHNLATAPPSNDASNATADLPDPTVEENRTEVGVPAPFDPDGLTILRAATNARIGVGRAGPRPTTKQLLLFQADHAITQDAIFSQVPEEVLAEFDLFTVQTKAADRDEYLLRPDLGRELSDEAKATIDQRCVKSPDVQIVVGDGLSAQAITNNLRQIYPVITQGLESAGVSIGTTFFVRNARVGVMNDINEIVKAKVIILLVGERPGLGVADALSVYSGWEPGRGKNDAHRDVTCMITDNGGMNPLEGGAFVVSHIQNVLAHQASGVDLRAKLRGNA